MARRDDASVEELVVDESETVAEGTEAAEKPAKVKKEPARGDLPEGYVTNVGLAKILTERGLHTNKDGETVEVKPQMVYSYEKNASEADPFPTEIVTDSLGKERRAVTIENGVAWWVRKNERAAERKANAAVKAEQKAAKAAAKAEADAAEPAEAVTEAE